MNPLQQQQPNQFLNQYLYDLCIRIFPDEVRIVKPPLLVALASGISAYSKSSAYYTREFNQVVLYQDLSSRVLRADKEEDIPIHVHNTLIHELTHWFQMNFILDKDVHPREIHKHASWGEACYIVACILSDVDRSIEFFKPLISTRTMGTANSSRTTIKKKQRDNALTQVQLTAFPRCLPEFLDVKR